MVIDMNLKGKKVLIVGLGKTGTSVLDLLLPMGVICAVQDSKSEDKIAPDLLAKLKENSIESFLGRLPDPSEKFDMLIVSPGVPTELDFIQKAQQNGTEIIGEVELAFRMSRGNFVAITGTNGKTTTTTLVGEIFENDKKDTFVVGNIGTTVTSIAHETKDESWIITETSSFQLETIRGFKPRISAFLNISPDHLDRYGNMQRYIASKARIFEYQDENDYFVVNYDDKQVYEIVPNCKAKVVPFSRLSELTFGVFVKDDQITIADGNGDLIKVCRTDELVMLGTHNLENALASTAIAHFAGVSTESIAKTLKTFSGVEHRVEFCGEINGVKFVNDSKGTNVDSSMRAIEAINGSIILIAGGYDKKVEFDELFDVFSDKVKHVILIGTTANQLKETAERKGFFNNIILENMEQCVQKAFELAKPGDTILLSPACSSQDMYLNFEERGAHFKNCVKNLEK